jgi:integrase
MREEIKVHVVKVNNRPHYFMRYTDPETGKRVAKSSGETDREKAVKAAGKWEDDLRAGRYQRVTNPTWAEFREKFEDEVLAAKSQHTFNTATCVFNRLESIGPKPERLRHVTTDCVKRFVKALREEKKSEQTIRSYLKNLLWAMRWARKQGMLAKLPEVDMPGNDDGEDDAMKGRPITTEEFERMLAAITKAFKPKGDKQNERLANAVKPAWKFYLEGLWWSGLRLEESLNLWWDREDRIQVDLTGDDPVFIIPKGMQKNRKSTVCPMAPEFAELLATVPEAQRTGPVFRLPGLKLNRDCRRPEWVGTTIRRIGKAANVVVERKSSGKVKFASAHDLRRSFGERWAHRILPKELMEVMRHRSIETTMRYYVGRNAKKTASAMRAAYNRQKVSVQVSAADSEETAAQGESRKSL